jgi:integrase
LLAILLGGGLKVGEARKLQADHVGIDASALRLVRPDNGRAYEVPVFSFARVPILAWLAVRAASGASGELVFPATVEGRPLHPASLYRRVEMLLDEAGVLAGRSERASPQTLRNSYGAMHFDAKAGPAVVSQYMGMRDTESGWRLRSAYEAWQARSGQTMIANREQEESSAEWRGRSAPARQRHRGGGAAPNPARNPLSR